MVNKTAEGIDEVQEGNMVGTKTLVTWTVLSSPHPVTVLLPSPKWWISSGRLRQSQAIVPWIMSQVTSVRLKWRGSIYPHLRD